MGITALEEFDANQAVRLVNSAGEEVARGLSSMNSTQLRDQLAKQHRCQPRAGPGGGSSRRDGSDDAYVRPSGRRFSNCSQLVASARAKLGFWMPTGRDPDLRGAVLDRAQLISSASWNRGMP